jgi:hypothetical protein
MRSKPWPFAATLGLAVVPLLLAMLSVLVKGWTSAVLTTVVVALALFGVIEFVHAWRWGSTQRE